MTVGTILLILGVGCGAGFLNTLAGGGSALTLPLLIFLGLPSTVANGTNRVAILVQNLTAVASFRAKGLFEWRLGLRFAATAALGAVAGSRVAVSLPESIFNGVLAGVLILVVVAVFLKPRVKEAAEADLSARQRWIASLAFLGVGFYGGFIQAGVGFIIITTLSLLTSFSLVKINSLKVFVIAIYTVGSLVVFAVSGNVNWLLGLTLAIGNAAGAYLGSMFAVLKGDKWVGGILVLAVLVMAARLVGLTPF